MIRRLPNRAGCAFVACLVITIGLPAPPGAASQSSSARIDYTSDYAANRAAADLGEALAPQVRMLTPFADIGIVSDGLRIGLTRADSGIEQYISGLVAKVGNPAAVPVIYTVVKHSSAELLAVQAEIDKANDEWRDRGVLITTTMPDHTTNTVQIGLSKYSVDAADLLYRKYGDRITVLSEDVNPEGSDSRFDDEPSFLGGDSIRNELNLGFCTSWFTVRNYSSSQPDMITAGHCGKGRYTNGGRDRGTITADQVKWVNGGNVDAGRTDNTGGYQDPWVWADQNTTYRVVHTVSTEDLYSTILCASGFASREQCGIYIGGANATVTYNGKTMHRQVYVECDCYFVGGGDSGGPVYSPPSDINTPGHWVMAYGMLVADVDDYAHAGWYTPARTVTAAFDADVRINLGS